MTLLRLLLPCAAAAALGAAPLSLQQLLDAAARSDAAQARQHTVRAAMLQQRNELLTDGFSLNAQGGYAKAKESADSAFEYHLSVESPVRTADTGSVERLLGAGAEIAVQLENARLQNTIYGYYIDACTFKEELWLLEDAKARGAQMEALIRTGMEGGEFDRSAWLRSRLNVQTLTLQIDELRSRYGATLEILGATVQLAPSELLCSDLPGTVALPQRHRFESAPLMQQLENRLAGANAMKSYRDTWLQEVTVGAGYDDEMDLRRGIVYASIPLGGGSRRDNEREAARQSALAAASELRTMRAALSARIASFTSAQQTRRTNLQRLNDELIPEAYETTDLLQERFMGSEASYLEYIDSQKALFALLMQGVQLRADALKAEAKLFAALGIAPSLKKDEK
jgi:outer membrane protein TolC